MGNNQYFRQRFVMSLGWSRNDHLLTWKVFLRHLRWATLTKVSWSYAQIPSPQLDIQFFFCNIESLLTHTSQEEITIASAGGTYRAALCWSLGPPRSKAGTRRNSLFATCILHLWICIEIHMTPGKRCVS